MKASRQFILFSLVFALWSSLLISCIKPTDRKTVAVLKTTDFRDQGGNILSLTERPCPPSEPKVDGGWSQWGYCVAWRQERACNNPAPRCGGKNCVGEAVKECAPHWCYDENGKLKPPRKPTQEDADRCWKNNEDMPKECITNVLIAAYDDPSWSDSKWPDFDGKCGCKQSGTDNMTIGNQKGRPLYECTSPSGAKFNISPVSGSVPRAGIMIPTTDNVPNYCMFDVSIGGDPWIGDDMTENCFNCHNPENPQEDLDEYGCPPPSKSSVIKKILTP